MKTRWPSLLGVDVSQQMGRTPFVHRSEDGNSLVGPTIMPGAMIWHFGRERLGLGREALEGQGFPAALHESVMAEHDDAFLQDLAGNAFGGTIIVSLALSMCFTAPFAESSSSSSASSTGRPSATDADVDQALQLLEGMI